MVPIALDPRNARLAIAGNGDLALRRLQALRAAGAEYVLVFADAAEPALASTAAAFLRRRLPDPSDLQSIQVLWIAGVAVPEPLAGLARRHRVLVNIEDQPAQCDFHSVAAISRKNLTLTVSTNGKAPGLAASIRRNLEHCFGPEWDARVDEVAELRAGWRAAGVPMAEAAKRIEALVAERCWLPCRQAH